ncbi:MAG: SDR family NAD(P)-dependent oxidoreductase [Bradymonadaceae bacterium]
MFFTRRETFENSVVWITGASAGIGRAVALELADRGARLALSARREEKLEAVADECETEVAVEPLDVTDRQRNVEVADAVVDRFGGLDAAFFNAGVFGTLGADEAFDAETVEWNMEVNYDGLVHGIDAALPHLRESDEGYVVGMSSAGAYSPMPRGCGYGASKVAVKYLMHSLDHEWEAKGVDVDVSVVCPGVVETPMTEDEDFPYRPPPSFFEVSPEWAASYIVDRMEKRTHEIRFPALFALGLKAFGMIPNPLHRWLLKLGDRMNVKEGA